MESELEVLMKCKCGWEETPHSEAQVPIRCTKCSATAVLPTAPWERGRYQRTVGALIEALKRRSRNSGGSPVTLHYHDSGQKCEIGSLPIRACPTFMLAVFVVENCLLLGFFVRAHKRNCPYKPECD